MGRGEWDDRGRGEGIGEVVSVRKKGEGKRWEGEVGGGQREARGSMTERRDGRRGSVGGRGEGRSGGVGGRRLGGGGGE